MKKIYFWGPVPIKKVNPKNSKFLKITSESRQVFVASAFAFLNSYLKRNRHDLYEQLDWSHLDFLQRDPEYIANIINTEHIDLLMVSVYVWNAEEVYQALKIIRERCPPTLKIIVGGPSVDPHRDKEYLNHHPYIDYAVYGQGEVAFTNILDEIINQVPLSILGSKNVCWRTPTGIKTACHEFLRDPNCSPIMDSEHLLKKIANNKEYKDYSLVITYETSKGCPYKCSFCDWESGLHNKVSHRKWSWYDELDVLGKLGFTHLYVSDANFGMHKQDMDIIKTIVALKKEKNYNFKFHSIHLNKLNKKTAYEIIEFAYQEGLIDSIKFAVEDTNPIVLENVQRPDIPWPEHKKLIDGICQRNPDMIPRIELIQGLPGQTRESWENTLLEINEYWAFVYPWYMLPNSPAYSDEYREKMKIKTMNFIDIFSPGDRSASPFVVETYSYNFADWCYLSLLTYIATRFQMSKEKKIMFDLLKHDKNVNDIIEQMQKHITNNEIFELQKLFDDYANKLVKQNASKFDYKFIKQWILENKN